MNNVSFNISKAKVYNEVAKTTSYGGKKAQDDGSAYERVRTTTEDEELLNRFWDEACDMVTSIVKPFLVSVNDDTDFTLDLSLPERYDTNLNDMLKDTAFSFIVNVIIAKWYEIANKDEVQKYTDMATALEAKIKSVVFHRKKPRLIQGDNTDKQNKMATT